MSGDGAGNLLNHTRETYGESFSTDLLEQYKLYVLSAENVSARRIASSRYLLTLNTALVALYGLQSATLDHSVWAISIPIMGIPASLLWFRIIKSHSNLNEIKFKIIHELEKHLPVALFDHEWKIAERNRGNAYSPVTRIERWIPIGFIVLHIVLTVIVVLVNVASPN